MGFDMTDIFKQKDKYHPSVAHAALWNAVVTSFDDFCADRKRQITGADLLLSRLIDNFSIYFREHNPQKSGHEGDSLSELYLEWTIDRYFAARTKRLVDNFVKLHAVLAAESEPFEYNDLDNHMFHVNCSAPERGTCIAIAITSQNRNYLYVLETNALGRKFHIRRYWDEHKKHMEDEYSELHKIITLEDALIHLDMLSDFSDCINGNKYIKRPSLAWFQANGLSVRDDSRQQYGDVRDAGYILSWDEWDNKADNIFISMPETISALRELTWAYGVREIV